MEVHYKNLLKTFKEPSTQKAKGLWSIIHSNPFLLLNRPTTAFLVTSDVGEVIECTTCNISHGKNGHPRWPWMDKKKLFGRPCPKTPRHGFVDSVKIEDSQQAKSLYQRALEADSEAEMLIMPYIEAVCSAIFIPESGALVIGSGHDGATSGHDSITLPCIQSPVDESFRDKAGIEKGSHSYFELVRSVSETILVQARSGPPMEIGVSEYIPRYEIITSVIEPTDDLLAWESLCVALKGCPGVAAWIPDGSLACHPAIHAKLNGIAFLTRKAKPKTGDILTPPAISIPPFDLTEFVRGVRYTETRAATREGIRKHLDLAIGLIHNQIPLSYSPYKSLLLGYSIGWIFRASSAACLGEGRHYASAGTKQGIFGTTNRTKVYEISIGLTNEALATKMATYSHKFMHANHWNGNGFGGWKWFAALVQTIKLWNLISTLQWEKASMEANTLLNMAHNGGWLFNKFCDQSTMTYAAERSGEFLSARIDMLWTLMRGEKQDFKWIKPRNYRSAQKWTVDGKFVGYKQVQMTVNKKAWKPVKYDADFKAVMRDVFEQV